MLIIPILSSCVVLLIIAAFICEINIKVIRAFYKKVRRYISKTFKKVLNAYSTF